MDDDADPAIRSEVSSEGRIQRARTGDQRAIQSLLVQHMPSLEAYVRLKVGARVKGKYATVDLVQSVCCDVLEDIGEFEYRGEGAFRKWLFTRALNKIINKNRFFSAKKRDAGLESPVSHKDNPQSVLSCYATMCTPSRHAMGNEAVEQFERAFFQLKEEYREAIQLYRVMGLSVAVRPNIRTVRGCRSIAERPISGGFLNHAAQSPAILAR